MSDHQLDTTGCAKLLQRSDVTGSVLYAILMRVVGDDLLQLDPIEMFVALEDAFAVRVNEDCENRINAMVTMASGPAFFNDPGVFKAVCLALSSGDVEDPADEALAPELSALSAGDMKSAMYEASLLYGDDTPPYGPLVTALFARAAAAEAADDGFQDAAADIAEVAEHTRQTIAVQLREAGFGDTQLPPI